MKKSGGKIVTSAVYEYQADCDGEWGEIHFDFTRGTANTARAADWDTYRSRVFAEQVIEHIRSVPRSTLPRDGVIVFEK